MRTAARKILSTAVAAAAAVCATAPASAQTDVSLSQFYEVPAFFNPGATGTDDFLRIRGGGRLQWMGIDNAPRTYLGTADMPFKIGSRRIGAGLRLMQESIGLYSTTDLGAQISYKIKKFGGVFSVGLQFGFVDQAFKGSEVYLPDNDDYHEGNDDAIPTTDIHGTAFDLGAGLWFTHPRFYAGISGTHLTSPSITMNAENAAGGSETSGDRRYEFQVKSTLYFTAGCNIPVNNTLFEIIPSVLVQTSAGFSTGELMARARYRKMFSFGLGYRWDDAVIATVAAEIKNFYIGYSYDYATSAIHSASSGSHELFVGYRMKLNLSEKNTHRHKSVRIM